MQENSNLFLEQKKVPDPFIHYKAELLQAFKGDNATGGILGKIFKRKEKEGVGLTKESAELGLLLINQHPTHKDEESRWSNIPMVTLNGKRYNRIWDLVNDDWNSPANFNLLVFFFGAEKAACVRHAWQQMPQQMYQAGSYRRSFRAPGSRVSYYQRQTAF